jgi:tetratricopeptide (TPR) repeat protein
LFGKVNTAKIPEVLIRGITRYRIFLKINPGWLHNDCKNDEIAMMNSTAMRILWPVMGLAAFSLTLFASDEDDGGRVKIWEETITMPTYFTDPPEECPIFFQHKSYQGASRVSYPYAEQDILSMKKGDKEYKALFIENEYIKLCVIPEIGGRLMYATDKTNGYELFYRQHVIKPMLIGMLGAWVSGGIEFCVFHHHRASTHMPVDYRLEENDDGSATIWIGEFEPRHRMRWNIGISLYPGRSWVRVDGTLINATENVNSILYWANVAVHVNEDYQVFFPPNTQYATYHAKNSFAHWPVTSETYNGNDYYQNHIDASWYRNHPGQGSFFAHDIDEGILAGYDWGKHAGTMHVANHHIVKGAKLWQWGTHSTFDREALTDDDGPYAELMAGAYSDNQPDYSWIKPYEVKKFRQTWYPLRETEGMKHGNLEAAVNLEVRDGGKVFIAANTTKRYEDLRVVLENGEKVLFEKQIDIDPATPFKQEIQTEGQPKPENLKLILYGQNDEEIVSYRPEIIPYNPELPPVVVPPGPPNEYTTNEELYYAGERIRQFHNARLDPEDYFLEALQRDPFDVRCNNAMGIISEENGDFESAKFYYRRAITRITANYTRPRDCEPLFHLGVVLKEEGEREAAIDTLYRAAWDYEFRSAAYFQLAQIYTIQKDYASALDAVDNALVVNGYNLNALSLKTSLLRLTGQEAAAIEAAHAILHIDQLNYYAYNELNLLAKDPAAGCGEKLQNLLRDYPENYLELASYYLRSGLYHESMEVLEKAEHSTDEFLNSYPTIHYTLGYLHHMEGEKEKAAHYFEEAMQKPIKYCFPFRLESIRIFETALDYNPRDSRACYYLGNLLYDKQPEIAIGWWERAVDLDPGLAMAYRNLGWGYQQATGQLDRAAEAYNLAIQNDPAQPRFYAEYDKLLELTGAPVQARLEVLSSNHEVVERLQPAVMREILVLVLAGEYDRAIDLLDGRLYYRQEDVNMIHDIHAEAHLLKGREYLESGEPGKALEEFRMADTYPENQMIERPANYFMNPRIYYYTALALEENGDKKDAMDYYSMAASQPNTDNEYLYYRAMALKKTGKRREAETIFASMIGRAQDQLEGSGVVDFFAKFGEEMTENQRKGHSYHIMGLGYLGMGDKENAREYLSKSLEYDVNQLWPGIYLEEL